MAAPVSWAHTCVTSYPEAQYQGAPIEPSNDLRQPEDVTRGSTSSSLSQPVNRGRLADNDSTPSAS
jgi:hypothetical protein